MNKSQNKVQKSEEKRLESLQQKADEYKQKQIQIREQVSNAQTNKKVFFSDNDDDDDDNEDFSARVNDDILNNKIDNLDLNRTKKTKKIKTEEPPIKNTLFDDDDDAEMEDANIFESKVNLDEEKANKLIRLKTKFSNDDRFKITERFVESEDSDGEEEKVDDEEIQLQKERDASLKILESITGKPIRRDVKAPKDEKASRTMNKMVRYDPTVEEHKKFEVQENEKEDIAKLRRETEKKKSKKADEESEDKRPIVDENRFYEIKPEMKELFCTKEVFKFQFGNEEEQDSEAENEKEEETKAQGEKRKMKQNLQYELTKDLYDAGSETSNESGEDELEDSQDEKEVIAKLEQKERRLKGDKNTHKAINQQPQKEKHNRSFIPDAENSSIQEALEFFVNKKTPEELKEEWTKVRSTLVDDYKKKHKKANREKRKKDDAKSLPWKNSSFNKKKLKKK